MANVSIEEYLEWMKAKQGYDFKLIENLNRFNTNIKTVQSTIAESPVVRNIEEKLREWASEYETNTHSSLFMQEPLLRFVTKPYESVIDKTYRLNALWNKGFPSNPPKGGWLTPENLFRSINDLVRTFLVCKFIDGPKFLIEKLAVTAIATILNINAIAKNAMRDIMRTISIFFSTYKC